MLIHKRFYSSMLLFLVVFSTMDSVCAPIAQQRAQRTNLKKIFNTKITQAKQFIRKHQAACAALGAAGVMALVFYLVPNRVRSLNDNPGNVPQIILQPGVQQGNWNPHLVDGYNGDYAWRELQTNNRLFVVRGRVPNRNQAVPEHNPIGIRFRLENQILVRQLQVARQEGNTCAYHALKNCQLILDELQNPQGNLDERLRDPQVVHDRIEYWRNYILAQHRDHCSVRDGQGAGDWLHPEGLQELVNLEDENNRITVVDAGRFQERLAQNPLALPRPFDFDVQNPNDDFVHGFVVQDRAHWLTAVVRRIRGRIEWWIVDSNNQPAFNRAGLMHLLARLHGRPIP